MKNKKGLVIGVLCITLVFISIGYSLFSTTLNITGSSQSSGLFDVKITNVEVDSNNTTSGATNAMEPIGANYAVIETTLSAKFNAPGDYITYDITVTNRGTIDAVISVETKMLDQTDAFTLSCDVQEGTEVLANNYITFPCRMSFKSSVESLENISIANMSVSLKAVQKDGYEPYVDQDNSCFVSFIPGEINYYDMNKPECGKNVVIPDRLRLPVTSVTSYEYNEDRCLANTYVLKPIRNWSSYTNEQACNMIKDEIENATLEEILQSDLALYTDFIYGEESNTRNLITKIGTGAFGIRGIESVSLSNNITVIGKYAFQSNLISSITLPPNLKKIDECAFGFNQIAGTLTFPISVTELGIATFEENDLERVVFDRNSELKTIPQESFFRNKLSSFVLPDKVEVIGKYSFSSNQLTSVNFENNDRLRIIDYSAFAPNTIGGTITFPKSLEEIGYQAFMGAINGTKNKITHIYFEEGSELETISAFAFQGNQIEGTLDLPDSLKIIGARAFYANRIETLNIGPNLVGIGEKSFLNNKLNDVLTLNTINIKMTEADWNTNVKCVDNKGNEIAFTPWYTDTPTINYNNS